MSQKKLSAWVELFKQFPVSEYVEAAIDAGLEDEVLKSVPFVSTLNGLYRGVDAYKKIKLRKKAEAFFRAADEGLDSKEIVGYVGKLDSEEKESFCENLLDIIERLESEQKAMIAGVALNRLIKGEISKEVFSDQSQFLNYIPIVSIFQFMHGYHNNEILKESLGDALAAHKIVIRSIGLEEVKGWGLSQKVETKIKIDYRITPIGIEFLKTLHQAYKEKIDPEHLVV